MVGCGLTSAAFALPPPPREEDAALLRWKWRGGERGDERGDEPHSGVGARVIALTPAAKSSDDALPWPAQPLVDPARLALPLLVLAVATTTLASGADYLVKAARVLSRFR